MRSSTVTRRIFTQFEYELAVADVHRDNGLAPRRSSTVGEAAGRCATSIASLPSTEMPKCSSARDQFVRSARGRIAAHQAISAMSVSESTLRSAL